MKLSTLMKAMSRVRDVDGDDILGRFGLQRRRSPAEKLFTLACIFGAGLVVGAGASLLASPVAPADVRRRLGEGVRGVKREIDRGARHVKHEAMEAARQTKHDAIEGAHNAVQKMDQAVQKADEVLPPRSNAPIPPRNGAIKMP